MGTVKVFSHALSPYLLNMCHLVHLAPSTLIFNNLFNMQNLQFWCQSTQQIVSLNNDQKHDDFVNNMATTSPCQSVPMGWCLIYLNIYSTGLSL